MNDHGLVGRRYAGEVKQIITGSIGFDDWEWGVDLFRRRSAGFQEADLRDALRSRQRGARALRAILCRSACSHSGVGQAARWRIAGTLRNR